MKVSELISKLKEMPPHAHVIMTPNAEDYQDVKRVQLEETYKRIVYLRWV